MGNSGIFKSRANLTAPLAACILLLGVAATAGAGVCNGTQATTAARAVAYKGFVITDVSLAGHVYLGAEVTLSFRGNTRDIYTFKVTAPDNGVGIGMCIEKGDATVSIKTTHETITANFLPAQVMVSFDSYNRGVGFSAYTGPSGFEPVYPLGFLDGTVFLTQDLFTPVNVSGNAWSCIGYPPEYNYGTCLDPNLYPLKTNLGDFVMHFPFYRVDPSTQDIPGSHSGSLNRGTFSIEVRRKDD
jgi:hypothetical protein